MQEIRWGIIGCGDVTEKKSGPAFQRVEHSRLLAVMRRDAEKAADFAARHQVPKWYSEASELINDPEITAVYIATPPSSHEEYAIAALKAGKHVYLEKPMAVDGMSAARILETAKNNQGKLVIAHYRRALPTFLKVQELLNSQQIGKTLFVDIKMMQPLATGLVASSETNWRLDPAVSGGGIFHDLAPHQLDLMLFYFGPIAECMGFSANQSKTSDADDFVSGLIKFESGVNLTGLWSFAAPEAEAIDSCTIIGTKGKISFPFFGEEITLWLDGKHIAFPLTYPKHVQEPMIAKVVDYFLDKGPNPCPAEEAVEVMRVMDVFTGKGG